jgi:hypothetical protein
MGAEAYVIQALWPEEDQGQERARAARELPGGGGASAWPKG